MHHYIRYTQPGHCFKHLFIQFTSGNIINHSNPKLFYTPAGNRRTKGIDRNYSLRIMFMKLAQCCFQPLLFFCLRYFGRIRTRRITSDINDRSTFVQYRLYPVNNSTFCLLPASSIKGIRCNIQNTHYQRFVQRKKLSFDIYCLTHHYPTIL